ncbi:MAG: PP0621 family protein [Limnohabitans sp.]
MKYLFWLLVILLVWWAYRRTRATAARQEPPQAPATQDMVVCTHCGIHLPRDEAVAGTRGQYCSTAHRSAAGDRNPD